MIRPKANSNNKRLFQGWDFCRTTRDAATKCGDWSLKEWLSLPLAEIALKEEKDPDFGQLLRQSLFLSQLSILACKVFVAGLDSGGF